MTPDPIEQIAKELAAFPFGFCTYGAPLNCDCAFCRHRDAIAAALRQQREAGQQEARQQVGEGLFTAKYLNPGCAEKGCQFLQREAGQPLHNEDRLFAANAILAVLRMGVCPYGYDRDDLREFAERMLRERTVVEPLRAEAQPEQEKP